MAFNLSLAVKDVLTTYNNEINEAVLKVITEVSEEAAEELHSAGSFKGTKYRAGWSTRIDENRVYNKATVYNKKHYRLTHLLEYGHAKVNGGRVEAFKHIAPINEKAQEKAVQKIKEAIKAL